MQTTITPEIKEKAVALYQKASAHYSFETPLAVLHIAPDYTQLALGTKAEEPDAVWEFAVGTEKIAKEFFKHNPPTSGEVENAIATVEDEIMPVSKLIPQNSRLMTFDEGIHEIEQQLPFPSSNISAMILFRDNLETVFTYLAAIVSGRPASWHNIPTTPSFIANIIIVREIMFHMDFNAIANFFDCD